MKWPWKRNRELQPYVAELPGNRTAGGKLDAYSETWVFVREHCKERLYELRTDNDNPKLGTIKTAVIRGQIDMLNEILDLPKPKPGVPWQTKQG